VENSLDACESIGVLPEISVDVTEYTQAEFNEMAGIGSSPRKRQDKELFQKKGSKKKQQATEELEDVKGKLLIEVDDDKDKTASSTKKTKRKKAPQDAYFRISVTDNGCGMAHNAIPDLFGRVLSGSKYGVRQTRGKFGLGAKMALIWSKKSTGQPIHITTAHRLADETVPSHISTCLLDIDIYKNEPRVLEHSSRKNTNQKIGTTVEVLIAGNWSTYRSRIVQYLQQLAIITPYAVLTLKYQNESDPKRRLDICYSRRSEQMPPVAKIVKHHPSSVNNLVIQQLMQFTRAKTVLKFLSTELASVSPAMAKRLVAELSKAEVTENMAPSQLTNTQITRLVQLLKQVQLFKAPDGSCLSPAGEYNLNLGIRKVLEPDLIATARDKPGAYEGHPFVVEAAVSLGGSHVKEGIAVIRFANRIPLLFEGGADVCTRVAQTKIRWANYKIDHKKDKVGVFVSIVSTKVPFKGTSKEYIGDDATEIQQSVKRALQSCCQQLRVHLMKRNAIKDAAQRKSRIVKYIPDVGRSLFGLLDQMRKRHAETTLPPSSPATKRLRLDPSSANDMIRRLNRGEITEDSIRKVLTETIEEQQQRIAGDDVAAKETGERVPLFLVPLYNLNDPQHDVCHALFTFRPIYPLAGGP
jgi:DNA topoisomerase-6 subunit B